MTPVETIPGTWEREIKEINGGSEFNYVVLCKNFCKCHNVPPVQ
jgi:hypothetical protein